jgi:hypothetical protein
MEIVYIIVCSLSYFVGYYVRGLHDDNAFLKVTGMSMYESLEAFYKEMEMFDNSSIDDKKEMVTKIEESLEKLKDEIKNSEESDENDKQDNLD